MSTEQNDKISRIKDNKAKLESENTQIQQRINDFQNESKKALESFSSSLNQTKSSTLSEINSLISSIDNLTKELEDYKKKSLLSEKEALNNRLNELLGEVSSDVQNLQKVIVDLSTKQEEDVSSIYSQMAGKVNTGLGDIYSGQRKQINEFESSISNKLSQIQRDIVSTVEGENANQLEMTESIATSFLESLSNFQSRIRELADSKETNVDTIFTGTVNDSVTRLEVAKEDLSASIDGVMNDLEESLAVQRSTNEEMQKTIQEIIAKAKSDVNTRIESQLLESKEDWERKQNEHSSELLSIKDTTRTTFQDALSTNELNQKKLLTDLENQFKTNLYDEIDNITLSFSKFQDSILNQIDALVSRLTSARDEMKESLDGLLVTNLNKIGGIGKHLEQQLSTILSQVSGEYNESRESVYSSLKNAVDAQFSAINSSLDQYKQVTFAKLNNTANDLDVSLMNFFDTTKRSVSDTINKNSGTLDKFKTTVNESFLTLQSGQEKNIETTLTDIRNILNTKQSELITTISSISPTADDYVESNREHIETRKSEISRSSGVAFDDLRKEITTIEQESMTAIRSIIGETHQKLDENVKTSEESIKDLIEGLEDEHKNSIAKFRANTAQELNKNLDTLNEYRDDLHEKFVKFFDNQQHTLDLFIDTNRTQRESIDDQRRTLDVKLEELGTGIDTAAETLTVNINTNTGNVTTSVKQILKDVDDVIKTIK